MTSVSDLVRSSGLHSPFKMICIHFMAQNAFFPGLEGIKVDVKSCPMVRFQVMPR